MMLTPDSIPELEVSILELAELIPELAGHRCAPGNDYAHFHWGQAVKSLL